MPGYLIDKTYPPMFSLARLSCLACYRYDLEEDCWKRWVYGDAMLWGQGPFMDYDNMRDEEVPPAMYKLRVVRHLWKNYMGKAAAFQLVEENAEWVEKAFEEKVLPENMAEMLVHKNDAEEEKTAGDKSGISTMMELSIPATAAELNRIHFTLEQLRLQDYEHLIIEFRNPLDSFIQTLVSNDDDREKRLYLVEMGLKLKGKKRLYRKTDIPLEEAKELFDFVCRGGMPNWAEWEDITEEVLGKTEAELPAQEWTFDGKEQEGEEDDE